MADEIKLNLKNNNQIKLALSTLSDAEIRRIVSAIEETLQDEFNTKADQSLENVDDEVFKQKAEQAGVGGSDVTIDTEMSDTSENPVQNKVVKGYVDTAIQEAILDSWEVAV